MSPALREILSEMQAAGDPQVIAGRSRFGIRTSAPAFGLTVPKVRAFGRRIRRNQEFAEELWQTGIHEARLLAAVVGDPARITSRTMDRWAHDFDSWDICDSCAYGLFDRTPFAWRKVEQFAKSDREFVRRAAFAMIAGLAVHAKDAPDQPFLEILSLIERYAFDDRNFVRKAVNWALRGIGKRNEGLRQAAIERAIRIRSQDTRSARWIGADALRELERRTPRPGPA